MKKLLTSAQLRKYQWRAFWWVVKRLGSGLFLDMGLGKTIIMLSAIKHLKHKGKITKPVLIVAPIRVIYSVWRQEAAKWKHTRNLRFALVHGSQRQRLTALNQPADIYLTNPHNLVWLIELFSNRRAVDDWPFEWLIIDESSQFKAAGTKRFSKLRHAVTLFKRRTILTGTPRPNHLMELWPQLYIVDAGERLGTAFTRFKERFFYQSDHQGFTYEPRRGAENYIVRLISDVVLRMDAADHLDVPPTIYNEVAVDLPEPARALYDEFEEEMFLEMAEGDVEALNAAVLSMRCHQIANGAIYTIARRTGQQIWEPVHDAKLEALREIIDEVGTPVLVAYNFKHDLARLRALYPDAPVLGNPKMIDQYIAGWQKNKYQTMFMHPGSAAHGLDGLQHGAGCDLVFFSLTWSREKHDQLIARIGGARANKRIRVHYIVARNTVDEAIRNSNVRKGSEQRASLNALKEYQRAKQNRIPRRQATEFEVLDSGARRYPTAARRRR